MEKIVEGKKEEKIRELISIILNSKPTGVTSTTTTLYNSRILQHGVSA